MQLAAEREANHVTSEQECHVSYLRHTDGDLRIGVAPSINVVVECAAKYCLFGFRKGVARYCDVDPPVQVSGESY